jgi:hypothetical protein
MTMFGVSGGRSLGAAGGSGHPAVVGGAAGGIGGDRGGVFGCGVMSGLALCDAAFHVKRDLTS